LAKLDVGEKTKKGASIGGTFTTFMQQGGIKKARGEEEGLKIDRSSGTFWLSVGGGGGGSDSVQLHLEKTLEELATEGVIGGLGQNDRLR